MNNKFWEEYIENSIQTIKIAIYLGIIILFYTMFSDFLNAKPDDRLMVVALRLISIIYLLILVIFLTFNNKFLKNQKRYYYFLYSMFLVVLFTALSIGYINEQLTTFYFFAIIELELFYSMIIISEVKIFSFFIIFANLLYLVIVFISNEPITSTTISIFSSFLPIAPLSIYMQNLLLKHRKDEYFKRMNLSIEINKKEHAQIRLIEAKEIAEKANNAKSLFIGNLSHEVRTPIHAISNYSRMGMDRIEKLDKKKTLHYFNQINISTERLLKLVNELLDFTKLESEVTKYNYQLNNILSIIKKSILELKVLSDKKNINVLIINEEIQNIVYCDDNKIMQVMLNIIANAIKFSPENSQIKVFIEHRNNDFMLIKIEDEGIGVDKSELRTIFNDFTQGSKITNTHKGTGLGLSISRRIIINHGGEIWAVNNEEKGVTISFTLPKKQS